MPYAAQDEHRAAGVACRARRLSKGNERVTLKAGDAFFVPAETIHSGKNVGGGSTKVLSSYVVEKGKPLATMVKATAATTPAPK